MRKQRGAHLEATARGLVPPSPSPGEDESTTDLKKDAKKVVTNHDVQIHPYL